MTGFGSSEAEVELAGQQRSLRVEVRSVNHRFLQVKSRLPGEFHSLERKVEEHVKRLLVRGAVSLSVNLTQSSGQDRPVFDQQRAKAWVGVLREASHELGVEWQPDMDRLVQLPGVLGGAWAESDVERAAPVLLETVDRALAGLVQMRLEEGQAMADDLRQNAAQVAELVESIGAAMPAVLASHRDSLVQRVNELLDDASKLDPKDLAREVALLADRLDVSEEITRLRSHLEQLERLLSQGGSSGRKLDFLVQEFHREANTIGSKCSDAQISHQVIEVKALVERLREQVQNIE